MNRRDSIKAMFVTAGGIASLPAWAEGWTLDTVPPATGVFNATEQQVLASIADTIIPKGDSIGALSVGVDKFLVGLLANCYEPDVQENVVKQVASLNTKAVAAGGKDFAQCDQKQREALLLDFSTSSEKAEKDFFNLMKTETIRGFNTSKEVMLGYLKYKVVPGHYYGCVDATT